MKYITPIKFPKFVLDPPNNSFKRIAYTNPFFILRKLGVLHYKYFDLQCLEALIMPHYSLEIHKDIDGNGNPGVAWSLLFCPDNNDDCFLEIYEETPETKLLNFTSVSNFKLTHLDPKSAKLVDSWNMKDSACIFNAGDYWHSVRNPTNNYIHMLSFRSKKIESLDILKNLIEPLI